ncbi:MAG TPA: hypothetical protein VGX23_26700 [Actinocrinis sp.]|nr:hypothetical protein [Actinocrinis sp.]
MLRVLRPDGLLALWWNKAVRPGDWETEQAERLTAVAPGWQNGGRISSAEAIAVLGKFGLSLTEQQFAWERDISVENHLVNLVSKSYVAELADRDGFIESERRILLDAFPSGRLTERFTTRLLLITR